MTVSTLVVDPLTGVPVVLLRDRGGQLVVPITIGKGEASAIAAELDGIELERPLLHQLTAALLAESGAHVARVVIREWVNEVFYASVELHRPDGSGVAHDARCSDAIALALYTRAPIHVAKPVIAALEQQGVLPACLMPDDYLEGLEEAAFGKWKI